MVYQWASAARIKVSAQDAGELFESLEKQGRLTPHDVVEESRPENAPLHNAFEWDDSIAAEKYRETQGAYLIRHITIKTETTKQPVRAFHSISVTKPDEDTVRNPERVYRHVSAIMRDRDSRETLLANAFLELAQIRKKYATLSELADVFAAIDVAMGAA